MVKTKQIEKFIKECFDELSINYKEYFYYDYAEDGNYEDICWSDESGNINMDAVAHASKVLGISTADILSVNEDAAAKWLKKYPYFFYVKPFCIAYARRLCDDSLDTSKLYEALYDPETKIRLKLKMELSERLTAQLREIDKVLPGTFHSGAQITNLYASTYEFCRFGAIAEMTESYITMINNVKRLFLKAINDGLTDEEVQEYNLLVSALGFRDSCYTKGYLYYDGLIKAKDVYSDVTSENIYEYVTLKRWKEFQPWRCADFINNRKLVERYLSAVPQAKAAMGEYSMLISHYICDFIWSDAKAVCFSPEEEVFDVSFLKAAGETPVSLDERAKEHTVIYVKKTAEELAGNEIAAEKLAEYCRPKKLGGIPVKAFTTDSIERITALLEKIPSNNLVQLVTDNINRGVYEGT